jgi:hypothetical protein
MDGGGGRGEDMRRKQPEDCMSSGYGSDWFSRVEWIIIRSAALVLLITAVAKLVWRELLGIGR